VRLADGLVEEQRIVANSFLEEEKAKGIQVAEWLVAQKVDVVLVKESLRGRGPVYVFRDAGIALRQTDLGTLAEAIRGLREAER
jgi:predicted Fe-Mo cluster-binding NifX family protein